MGDLSPPLPIQGSSRNRLVPLLSEKDILLTINRPEESERIHNIIANMLVIINIDDKKNWTFNVSIARDAWYRSKRMVLQKYPPWDILCEWQQLTMITAIVYHPWWHTLTRPVLSFPGPWRSWACKALPHAIRSLSRLILSGHKQVSIPQPANIYYAFSKWHSCSW